MWKKENNTGRNYSVIFVNLLEVLLQRAKRGRKETGKACNTR
jgi:hypothetical protein